MTEDKKQALIARSQARLKAAVLPTQGSGCAHRCSPPPIAIKPPDWFVWRNTLTGEKREVGISGFGRYHQVTARHLRVGHAQRFAYVL